MARPLWYCVRRAQTLVELWRPQRSSRFCSAAARTRPMCLYFTQNRCSYMDNPEHLQKFSHSFPALPVDPALVQKAKQQPFEHFLVLDLEGKVEILEFPVVLLSATTLQVVDRFHRFVRPCKLHGERLQAYIGGKYGRWGLEKLWEDTAIPFDETLHAFETWLEQHRLLDKKNAGSARLERAAFVTCGNWDIKTKIPEQCLTSGIRLPTYFSEWINLKDVYLNFYNIEVRLVPGFHERFLPSFLAVQATGMLSMLKGLGMTMQGSHHLGLDDAHNLARLLQRMVCDGAVARITGTRKPDGGVEHFFLNRIQSRPRRRR